MATYCGNDGEGFSGEAPYGSTPPTDEILNVRNWSVTLTQAVVTGAHSGSAGYQDACVGTKGWNGTIEFYRDAANSDGSPLNDGDIISIKVHDGVMQITGDIVVSDLTYGCDVEGGEFVSTSGTFVGVGAPEIKAKA